MTTERPLPRYTPVLVADPTPPLPHAAPDTRGDWTLMLWVPVVFAVAALRWVRIRVGVALIDLGARILPETRTGSRG